MIKEVKTPDDSAVLTKEIIAEGVAIHPDDDFADVVNAETELDKFIPLPSSLNNFTE
jgi:hypothetical protein